MTTYLKGEFTIEPVLEPALVPTRYRDKNEAEVFLVYNESDEDLTVVDGELVIVGKKYTKVMLFTDNAEEDILPDVKEIAAVAKRHKRTMSGAVEATGEEHRDIWRVRVTDNEVYVEEPKLLWPNGDQTDLT